MKQIYYSIILSSFLFACGQPQKTENPNNNSASPISYLKQPEADTVRQAPAVNPYENAKMEVKTFQNTDNGAKGTWGYDIYVNKGTSPAIHQPSIPSIPGNRGFTTEANAGKTGAFVAYKIKHNIMPPALNHHELDSLGVLN